MTTDELINLVAELAQEVDKEDTVDFGMLSIDDSAVWHTMAANVIDLYLPHAENKLVMLSTITKLVVENFVLNLKLMKS